MVTFKFFNSKQKKTFRNYPISAAGSAAAYSHKHLLINKKEGIYPTAGPDTCWARLDKYK